MLPHTRLVVTHAGHGTVMAAASAGVPMVCVPMGRDQVSVAARVTRHGLGVSVQPEGTVEELRCAIIQTLRDPAYERAARRMAAALEPADRVIDEIETDAAPARSGADPPYHDSSGSGSLPGPPWLKLRTRVTSPLRT